MSRKIKFRGIPINSNQFIYGDLIQSGGYIYIFPSHMGFFEFSNQSKRVTPETVGQFTGLTDKNGKEIYEGDVVRLISGGSRWNREACEVVFLNGSFQFNRPDWPYPCGFITYAMSCSERYIIDDHSELCSQIEVIGNIHENPELI